MSLKALEYEKKFSTYDYLKRRAKIQKCEEMKNFIIVVADTFRNCLKLYTQGTAYGISKILNQL